MTRGEKAKATRAAQKERMASQTVTIDDHWQIIRADPLNWEIRYKGKFQGYYGTIGNALCALPSKMLNESAKGTLTDIRRTLEGISSTIEKAIP